MVRVAFGINQAIETIREHCDPQGPIVVEAHFDEFNLDVKITYRGAPLERRISVPPEREIMDTDDGLAAWPASCSGATPTVSARRKRTARRCWSSTSSIEFYNDPSHPDAFVSANTRSTMAGASPT